MSTLRSGQTTGSPVLTHADSFAGLSDAPDAVPGSYLGWDGDGVLAAVTPPTPFDSSYGGCYENNETGSAISLVSNAALYKWVTASEGATKAGHVTFDGGVGNHHLVIGASGAGVYLVNCHFSVAIGAANEVRAAIFVNETQQVKMRSDQDVAAQAKYQSGSMVGLLTLAVGDIISLRFGSDANNQTVTVKHANLDIVRIG